MGRRVGCPLGVALLAIHAAACGGGDPEEALLRLPHDLAAAVRAGDWGGAFDATAAGFEAHGRTAGELRMLLPRALEQMGVHPHVALVEDRTPGGGEGTRELVVLGLLVGPDPGAGDPRRFQPFRVVLRVEPSGGAWRLRAATLER